jgi:predicted nucleic acid-binding protein
MPSTWRRFQMKRPGWRRGAAGGRVQELLTRKGQHRSAGAVDLVVAATAELQGLTLLHRDRDFDCIAAVTGQPLQWYGPDAGK